MTSDIITNFFNLSTRGDLDRFINELNVQVPMEAALRDNFLIFDQEVGLPTGTFHPETMITRDFSAIMYGHCPTIFLGTNNWFCNRYLSESGTNQKTLSFGHRVSELTKLNRNKFCFVIVPEKDYVIDNFSGRSETVAPLRRSVMSIGEVCRRVDVGLIFDGFLQRLPLWSSALDYSYPDSHLLGRDYYLIFCEIIKAVGLEVSLIENAVSYRIRNEYGDLSTKFPGCFNEMQPTLVPIVGGSARLVEGHNSFQTPLGATVQNFRNDNPVFDLKVEICGDSHSSIYKQHRLTYLFAETFRECTFRWVPWAGAPDKFQSDADIVVMEISQRFIFT